MKRETITQMLNGLDDSYISEAEAYFPEAIQETPERIFHMKKKKIIASVLAAALILALGISAYAIWGAPRSTGTHLMPKMAEYTSLSALPKIEKDVGYPVTVPERFSNGYSFAGLRVGGQAVFGENNEVLKEYYAVSAVYSMDGAPDLRLELSPLLEHEGESDAPVPIPDERRTVNGVMVDLSLDHYKVVPDDYEKTEDDLAREAAGHYYVSFGSDEIEEYEMAFAEFPLGEVVYVLMDMEASAASLDVLAHMAGELIEEACG